jgi:hypothetical protein
MRSQFNQEWKKVSYLVQWNGYPNWTDWTEEPYMHLNHKQLVREFHVRNHQAAKDNTLYIELESFLLRGIVVPGGIHGQQ